MKHVLPLTYEPKIQAVRDGTCSQTIRPKSESKPKDIGDCVMFHGWSGRPYHSRWSWRTPYMEITDTFLIRFLEITSNNTVALLKYFPSVDRDHYYRLPKNQATEIAKLDGFDTFEQMVDEFKNMYGNAIFDIIFRVIRWGPKSNIKEEDSAQIKLEID